jgi:two-component system capsular synthesis sensor histidine kinase RcsC
MNSPPELSFTVVDDDPHILFFVTRTLEQAFAGCTINSFEDGTEALRFLRNNHSDFLITDQSMVRMNGEELIEELRKQGITIPTLMISNSPDADKAALRAGVAFVEKGRINRHLHNAVRSVLALPL